ncbi:peptidoglycan DD-metalloendopeptidase family protein [Lentzea sp. NPDC003310]|uniref:peptidoglycan DD-metalloendopeptidase family protein n=1 Tax=Lentzea sp. NPDC003310 TaxID=3154447 RepID=UPI0033BC221F
MRAGIVSKLRAAALCVAVASGLTVSVAAPAQAAPAFQLPFACGQQWRLDTWGHSPALDMVREPNQVGTEGAAVHAPAAGTVNQSYYHSNAGNMIQINHGNGHFTTYLHLQVRLVEAGTHVAQGQLIGRVGRTGPTSNNHPHLHYEQGFDSNGNGVVTWGAAGTERVAAKFNGVTYTGSGSTWRNVTSRNCGGGAWDCQAGYSCYYDGTDGQNKLFTAARCGTHDLRGGIYQDRISSIANYGSGKVWVYVWDVESGDHFDLHGWVEVGTQGNFYTNDIDKIHIDC